MFNDLSCNRIPQTHQECYDEAVDAVMKLGINIVVDTVISLGSTWNPGYGIYIAYKLYMIYLEYDACLERVYSQH